MIVPSLAHGGAPRWRLPKIQLAICEEAVALYYYCFALSRTPDAEPKTNKKLGSSQQWFFFLLMPNSHLQPRVWRVLYSHKHTLSALKQGRSYLDLGRRASGFTGFGGLGEKFTIQ
ncbi:hypothetical protein ABW19_dt0204196 [Dactylella cylindrospora]|nr:hypothetical protein ABW19_dt0204196 [Dactylella cylindrospora]